LSEGWRTLLVSGGAGFIGSTLIRHLIRNTGHTVVNLDCLTYAGSLESLAEARHSPRYRFEKVDIRDEQGVRRVLRDHKPDSVIHLAAESHVDRSIDGPAVFLETNVFGTFMLLEAALGAYREMPEERRSGFRFLHVSTDEVYGSAAQGTSFSEASRYSPNSPYAASKAAADHLVRAWGVTYDLPVLTTNCSNNYGPYQFPEKLIPHMTLSALEGRQLEVYGDGRQVRDWLHVQDHVRALLTILERASPGAYLNIGGGAERENIEVVTRICEILDELCPLPGGRSYRRQITPSEDRPGHDRRYAMDATRLTQELGWTPEVDFDSGLRETVQWYLENREWWQPIRERVYRGQRLGRRRELPGIPVPGSPDPPAGGPTGAQQHPREGS
jgi:dTDP-glucose 4,6-dehydratase